MKSTKRTPLTHPRRSILNFRWRGFLVTAASLFLTFTARAELPPAANLMAYYPLDGVVNVSQTP
ncbi:MAG TPA: hypothetical protein VI136_00500, partial [Verrucomicrobiae bacterium]